MPSSAYPPRRAPKAPAARLLRAAETLAVLAWVVAFLCAAPGSRGSEGSNAPRDEVDYRVDDGGPGDVRLTITAPAASATWLVIAALPGHDLRAFTHRDIVSAFRSGVGVPLSPVPANRASGRFVTDIALPRADRPTTVLVWCLSVDPASGRTEVAPAIPLLVAAGASGGASGAVRGGATPTAQTSGATPTPSNGQTSATDSITTNHGTLPLQAFASAAAITIHDQPTPVQGSGH